jgi:hypothetical protein
MATQIENIGAALKITINGSSRSVMKSQIEAIEPLEDNIIKIDIGKGALNNIFINQGDVTVPASENATELSDQILLMIESASSAGLATEAKQTAQIAELQAVNTAVTTLNDKSFFEPRIVDETNPNVIYRGFALSNIALDFAGWAIQKITNNKGVYTYQWAGGTKSFDKVWNGRKTLVYS